MVDRRVFFIALIAVVAYWLVQNQFHNYAIPIIPYLWSFKPFEFLSDYGLFVGAFLALMVAYLLKRKKE